MSKEMSEMQREVLNRADVIFSSIAESVSKVKDFAAEQLPDIAQQFIMYNTVFYGIMMVFALSLLITGIYLAIRIPKVKHPEINILCGAISLSLVIPLTAINLKPFLMVVFAPKVFLIQEMVNLVK